MNGLQFKEFAVVRARLSAWLLALGAISLALFGHHDSVLGQKKPADAKPPAKDLTATPVTHMKVKDGFKVELLYSVPSSQGSWVSMTVDPKGRLITSDQY